MNENLKFFSDLLNEFQDETDRGAAMLGASLINDSLNHLIEFHFIECIESDELLTGTNSPIGSFGVRIKTAYCLGFISELEYKECIYILQVRSMFAKKLHGLKFNHKKVRDLCSNLKANEPYGSISRRDSRKLFINSVALLCLAFWSRSEQNQPNRTKQHEWKYQLGQ